MFGPWRSRAEANRAWEDMLDCETVWEVTVTWTFLDPQGCRRFKTTTSFERDRESAERSAKDAVEIRGAHDATFEEVTNR